MYTEKTRIVLRFHQLVLRIRAIPATPTKWPPVAITMADRPKCPRIGMRSPALSQESAASELRAYCTAMFRSSSRKIPRLPLVPEVVATKYLPRNRSPIRFGSVTNARTCSMVTSRSVIQSSKQAISVSLLVTGSRVESSTRSGRSW